MYKIEFSDAGITDLERYSMTEIEEVFAIVAAWSVDPRPDGSRPLAASDIGGVTLHRYESTRFTIFYSVWEAESLVKILVVISKINRN